MQPKEPAQADPSVTEKELAAYRRAEQAERNAAVDAVVGLEVEEKDLVDRMLRRGKESGRADDNIDTIKKRLDVYHKQTSPLKDYYKNEGKYHAINGNGEVENIFGDIKKSLSKVIKK